MNFEEFLKKEERSYKVEKEILTNFSKILKSDISLNNIQDTLDKNGFNGVYILKPDKFSFIPHLGDSIGLYDKIAKVIILNENEYLIDKKVGVHEMGHAYLDGRCESQIIYGTKELSYGKGLEEGAVTLLSCTSDIRRINNIDPFVYAYQSRLFQQLDVLYKYSELRKYDNLLIHLFKEPETFIPLIKNIYENLCKINCAEYEYLTILRSAFAMIEGADLLIDCDDKNIYSLLNCINAIYLNISDSKIRMGQKNNPLFVNAEQFKQTREDIFLEKLFNVKDGYYNRQFTNLNSSIVLLNEKFEQYDEESKIKTNRIY